MTAPSANSRLGQVNRSSLRNNEGMTPDTHAEMDFEQARDLDHEAEDQQPLICPECQSGHTVLHHSRYFELSQTWVQCLECRSRWTLVQHGGLFEVAHDG